VIIERGNDVRRISQAVLVVAAIIAWPSASYGCADGMIGPCAPDGDGGLEFRPPFKARNIEPVRGFAVDPECRILHRGRSFLSNTELPT
jgi:hypothetical protein